MGYYDDLDREIDHDLGREGLDPTGLPRVRPPFGAAIRKLLAPVGKVVRPVVRGVGKLALFPLITPRLMAPRFDAAGNVLPDNRSWLRRVAEGLAVRLMLTPVIVVGFFLLLVWLTTHPDRVQATQTPEALGLYYRQVDLTSSDGQALRAWYVPPLTADLVVKDGVEALAYKWPGVVLCHGLGYSNEQYLPLARRLHEAGFAVLLLSLRGQGESPPAAVTFGLRERFDVLAGVHYLQQSSGVNAARIAVVGHGIGGNAALEAAALDHSIGAVAADAIWPTFDDWTDQIFLRAHLPSEALSPLYRVTFELAMRERLDQLDMEHTVKQLHAPQVLYIIRNAPENPPVRAMMDLAAATPAAHRVLVINESGQPGAGQAHVDVERELTGFLCGALDWTPPATRVPETVQRLLDARVKK